MYLILALLIVPFISAENSIPEYWRINQQTILEISSVNTPEITYDQAYFSLIKVEELSQTNYQITMFTKITTPKGEYDIAINNKLYAFEVIGANDEIPDEKEEDFTDEGLFTRVTKSMDDKVIVGGIIVLFVIVVLVGILTLSLLSKKVKGEK